MMRPSRFQLGEDLARCPVGYKVGVGEQHAGRVGVRLEDADGLAALHKQGFVVLQVAQAVHDLEQRGPVARGLAAAAIDDEVLRTLGHFRVEVVHEHPERGLLQPAFATKRCAARCA